jgi:predicted house-cleaning NTP pyrophosphatase (Maf/HAM1 superfamily)
MPALLARLSLNFQICAAALNAPVDKLQEEPESVVEMLSRAGYLEFYLAVH